MASMLPIAAWIVAVGLATITNDWTSSGRWVAWGAGAVAVAAAVGAAAALRSGRNRRAGALLIVSGVTAPTSFAYPLNVVVVAIGIVLVVRSRSSNSSARHLMR